MGRRYLCLCLSRPPPPLDLCRHWMRGPARSVALINKLTVESAFEADQVSRLLLLRLCLLIDPPPSQHNLVKRFSTSLRLFNMDTLLCFSSYLPTVHISVPKSPVTQQNRVLVCKVDMRSILHKPAFSFSLWLQYIERVKRLGLRLSLTNPFIL